MSKPYSIPLMQTKIGFRCCLRILGVLLKYPSTFFELHLGYSKVGEHLVTLSRNRFSKKPIETMSTYGFEILLDKNDQIISPEIAEFGFYELVETELFNSVLKPGQTVVDVGANIGFFTLLSARKVGHQGRVIALEPEPTNCSLLEKSLKKNNFTNTSIFQCAASDIDGTAILYKTPESTGFSSIVRDYGGTELITKSIRLDALADLLGLKSIDLLKVDVEGAEAKVLSGARSLIENLAVKKIIMEWNHEAWFNNEELLKMLIKRYEMFQIIQKPPFIRRLPDGFLLNLPKFRDTSRNIYMRQRA